jgi:hypothetical protein
MFRGTWLPSVAASPPTASVAQAGTLSITAPNTITYQAAPGEVNFFTVNWGNVAAGGEDGDDDLQSQGSSDLLDGGPGNDRLQPDDHDAGSGDIVVGGPGVDSLWLDTAFGGNGPINASFDGVANDGFAGESDNYGADLENLEGVSTARPRAGFALG